MTFVTAEYVQLRKRVFEYHQHFRKLTDYFRDIEKFLGNGKVPDEICEIVQKEFITIVELYFDEIPPREIANLSEIYQKIRDIVKKVNGAIIDYRLSNYVRDK